LRPVVCRSAVIDMARSKVPCLRLVETFDDGVKLLEVA
jgi:hypothetical protein